MNDNDFFKIHSELADVRQVKLVYDIRLSVPLSKYLRMSQYSYPTSTEFVPQGNDPIKWTETVIEECNGRLREEFLETAVYFLNEFYYAVDKKQNCQKINKYRPPKDKTKDNYLEMVDSVHLDKVSGDMMKVAFYDDFFHSGIYGGPLDPFEGHSKQLMINPGLPEHMKRYYANKAPYAWFVECNMPIDSWDEFMTGYKTDPFSHQCGMLKALCESNVSWRDKGIWECVSFACSVNNFVEERCRVLAKWIPFKDAVQLSFNDNLPENMINALKKRCQDEIFSREQKSAD